MTQEEASRFVVGIDLGTTNSAVGYVDTTEEPWRIRTLGIPQLVAPGEVEARDTLPSFHYEASAGELPGGALHLPWEDAEPPYAVGLFARNHGATVPGRLITSVKSWLCHNGVDRTAAILPWHSAPDVERLSPVTVSRRYLAHIASAWTAQFPEYPLPTQDVILTVPASFDEVARELTVTAAQQAGLARVILLEEPQAAFYAWVYAHEADWQTQVQPGQMILVCDIGGGTTDFTLIQARHGKGEDLVQLHRVAVGDHLILGGDNLDLALAHALEPRLVALQTGKLSPRQWSTLVRICRQVKETLLGPNPPESLTVSVPGAGAKLIGSALQLELPCREAEEILVEGFVPHVALDARPQRRSGFQEFGLPYAPDPAISTYLAAFLTDYQQAAVSEGDGAVQAARPDIVLLNGGLFASSALRQRLLDVITTWFRDTAAAGSWQPLVLDNDRLDLAVAHGAAYYGMVRRGYGTRIAGGLARSHYIGVEGETTDAGPHTAVCLLPAGIEEGHTVDLHDRPLHLRIRQPVEFPLYTSGLRTTDPPGALVSVDPERMHALPPIRTVLASGKKTQAEVIPVTLHARLSEIGTLDLWCGEVTGNRTWRLQFDVRFAANRRAVQTDGAAGLEEVLDEATLRACCTLIHHTFAQLKPPPGAEPEGLVKRLEALTEMRRETWSSSMLRRFWEALMAVESGRQLSPAHEARWLNLAGFALRPGYGMAADDWRVAQTWRLFQGRVKHPRNEMCRAEWWILWRRIAGALELGQQKTLAEPLLAALRARWRSIQAAQQPRGGRQARASKGASVDFQFGAHESAEVWRLLGSLELLDIDITCEIGQLGFDFGLRKGASTVRDACAWALGRLGARVPVYGPLNTLVPVDTAEAWTQRLIALAADPEWTRRHGDLPQSAVFTVVQLTRLTGDRYRDVSDELRQVAEQWLRERRAPRHFVTLVAEGGALREEEQELVFSESLLPGLKIV